MTLKYGSLFAGYGGLEEGVKSVLGGELSWYAEWEKAPAAVMAHHHPDVLNLWDVTKVDWASVPKVDVITGGSPCQDLSHAGKHKPDGTKVQVHLDWVAENRLLPTPTAQTFGTQHGNDPTRQTVFSLDTMASKGQDWGRYEAAIRRQEAAFGYPAPSPTEPGAKGQPRLSPRFVEWLMALPPGWVTDPKITDNAKAQAKKAPRHMRADARVGISRNDQLKALGNGVCPPQAAAATRAFLHDTARQEATA